MISPYNPTHEYKIILLTHPKLKGCDNAMELVNMALKQLNDRQGRQKFAFGKGITAQAEFMDDPDALTERLKKENNIALVVTCGFPPDLVRMLAETCHQHDTQLCWAVPHEENGADHQLVRNHVTGRKTQGMKQELLINPLPLDLMELLDRVDNIRGALAIGVMHAHHSKNTNRAVG